MGPHRFAVFQQAGGADAVAAKEDAVQGGLAVFQGKVGVAAGRGAAIGNLADNPQVAQKGIAFQQFPQVDGHLADAEDFRMFPLLRHNAPS